MRLRQPVHRLVGVIVGATQRGLCWLSLGSTSSEAESSLRTEFPAATLRRDPSLSRLVDAALESVREGNDLGADRNRADALDLRGTVFQLRVWQALRQIPRGETRSYSQLAREMGDPKSTRAVARACATNRVALSCAVPSRGRRGRSAHRLPLGRRAQAATAWRNRPQAAVDEG